MTAPTPAEAARIAAFDTAPDAPESYTATIERMARAMWTADPDEPWDTALDDDQDYFLALAATAYRAVTEPTDTCLDCAHAEVDDMLMAATPPADEAAR